MKTVLIRGRSRLTFADLVAGDVFDWGYEEPGLPVALRLDDNAWTYLPDGDPDSAVLNPGTIQTGEDGEHVTRIEDVVLTVTI